MFRLRKLMPLFVTVILAGLIILPMWAADTEKDNAAANEIATLEQLKAAFEKGGSYKITADIVSDTYIEGYKDITLDLNGHKLSRNNITASGSGNVERNFILMHDGILTLNNSAGNEGLISSSSADGVTASPRAVAVVPVKEAIDAHPTVIINSGVRLQAKGSGINQSGCVVNALGVFSNQMTSTEKVLNTAYAVINEGAILDSGECPSDATAKAATVEGYGAKLQINGGKFIGAKHILGAYYGAEITINDGTFVGNHKGISNQNAYITIN